MTIRPEETEIRGHWIARPGGVEGDQNCQRIEELVGGHLRRMGSDASGWDVLYVDPTDGRYWELIYPESHLHGGGPPLLRHLARDEAKQKYGVS